MGEGFFKVVAFSLMLLFLLPMLNHSGMSDTSEQLSVNQENDNYRSISSNNKSDAWLNLELLSWQGNSSTTWDTDGTDMDVQFQVCIDLDGDSDGISPLCTWTEVWNNTLTLSNAWETTFDLIEDNTTLNITIECWDNDEFADEWGNGPDACDLNPDDDEWRLYYEANWSNITTETFSGDGSIGNDTQWGNAESTWKVTVSYYGDEDNDGVSDNVDGCEDTVIGDESDSAGCSWEQYDWDSDGIVNSEDQCPTSVEIYCSAGNQYLPTTKVTFTNNQIAESSVGSRAWDISPDGKHLAVIVDGNSLSQQRVGGGLVVFRLVQSFEFTKNGIGEGGNLELNGIQEHLSISDIKYFNEIIASSTYITEELYNEIKAKVDEHKDKVVRIPDLPNKKAEADFFLLSQLPMSLNVSDLYNTSVNSDSLSDEDLNCLIHDIVLYNIPDKLSEDDFYSELKNSFNSHPFVVELKEVIKSDTRQSLSYGGVVRWIQDNTTTVPTPRSWELKEEQIVNILYEWICYFDDDYYWERPNHTQVIFYKKAK